MIIRDYLICLLQMYLLEDLEKNILPYRRERFWEKFLVYCIAALAMFGTNRLESSILNMVMIPVIYMIASMVVFRGNIWKKLVTVCCYYVLAIIPEFLFAALTNAYGVTGASEGFRTETEKTLALLLMSTMTFLFIKCINQVTRKRDYLTIENKTFTVLLMLPTATIVMLGCMFYSHTSFEGMNRVMVPVGASLLLMTNIFIFTVFDRFVEKSEEVKKMDRLYQKSRAEIANLQYMNKVNEDNRAFLHDINKFICTVAGLIEEGENQEVKDIMEHLGVRIQNLQKSVYCEHPILNSILCERKLSFDLSVYDIFGILSAGGKLFLPDENRIADPSYLFETIVKQKITVWNSVPAIMQMILEYRENEKRTEQFNIRCSLLSGDWIPLTLPERLISACMEKTRVISLGGATEAAIWSIYYEYEYLFDEWKSIPYGKALPNQEVYVLDSKKEICPLGAVGDIFISGIGLAKGYLNEPLLTEKAFIMVNGERMYDTGDKGKYLEDGNIEFLGRRDTQVKLNGFRVELGEIEANIEKIKSVKYAAVLCREKGREKRVIAYVEPQPSEFTEDFSLYVLNELKRMLPAYMIPYNIRVMKLPLTSNGKIDRKYLKNIEIVEDKKEADTKNTINSDSSTYFPIKEIWCKLLQRSDIRPDSDLRSFGADSLIMAQAVGKIRNFLKESGSQCDVPFDILLKQTINSPTLSEIVSYIDQIILKKEVNSRYEDAEVNEEELGKLKIHKKGKEDKLVVIFHAGLGSIDEFLPFIQGLCNEEKGTIVSIALNNVKQYLDFYAGHLYESVADKYTKIILDLGYDKIQLIGHCVGGMIAFEVAKNMMDKGVDVIDVSLIDSIPGKYSIEDEVVMELMFLPMVNITYPVLAEYQLNERELYEYMDEKFGKYTGIEQKSKNKVEEYINGLREIEKEERIRLYINSVSKNMPIQMFVYLFDIFKQSTNGAIYKPIPYLGDIRLFIAEDTEKIVFHRSEEVINFWRENCIGDVTVIMIPGNHLTCFTDVNNIQKLVNKITEK